MNTPTTELTRAELEVMQVIWEKGRAFMSDIYEGFPEGENRPAYTTISTFVRILHRKGYIGHKSYGKSHEYYPIISKEEYTAGYMQNVMHNFFDNSPSQLLSFFAKSGKLTTVQYEELKAAAEKIINQK